MIVKISPGLKVVTGVRIKPYQCFVCDRVKTYRDKHDHLLEHFNNPDQNLTCRKCKVYKHIPQFRFKQLYCRLFTYSQISIVINYN